MASSGAWGKGPAVTARQVVAQAGSDLLGKEVQNGYTVSYVWMTNQLGHFTLGLLFILLVVWAVEAFHALAAGCSPWSVPLQSLLGGAGDAGCLVAPRNFWSGYMLPVPLLALGILVWKEARDYGIAVSYASGHAFPVDRGDIFKDAATAVWFYGIGVLVAYTSFVAWLCALLVFLIGLAISMWPALYWLSRKTCFQRADLPFLYRLADFNTPFAPAPAANQVEIARFLAGEAPASHLLVFGDVGSGRTSLAVGIGTEHCFAVRTARYLTWAKFIEEAQPQSPPTMAHGATVWPWPTSDFVVFDDVVDVVAGTPRTDPASIVADLQALPRSAIAALGAMRAVWVLGPSVAPPASPADWIAALGRVLGLPPDRFRYVSLAGRPAGKPTVPIASLSGH